MINLVKWTSLVLIILCPFKSSAEDFSKYNKVTQYDKYFSKYTKRNFGPAFDWRRFKAQAIAESRLDNEAKSYVGAIGVMQIMPSTYDEITQRNKFIKGASNNPKWNIAAGISYNRSIWNIFKAERPFQDRLNFTYGAYNAGKGSIIKAQKVASKKGLNPNLWASIELSLPKVTGKHSKETINYVEKISEIKKELR